ncbi:MAG: hypothetical protein DRJ36_03485 [Thermoprotei archaeon]|nr:MAG: hypothetical protein DRJ36_03485 [Thermoprotei archaeon]
MNISCFNVVYSDKWRKILVYLEEIRKRSFVKYAYPISQEEGMILYSITFLLATYFEEINIVEAGSGIGYSTLWFLLAIKHGGRGTVHAIERNEKRAKILINNVTNLGLDKYLRIYIGEAIKVMQRLSKGIHLAFIDIDKHKYIEAFKVLENNVVSGGVILAHNAWMVPGYVEYVLNKRGWMTTIIPSDEGIVLSIKI